MNISLKNSIGIRLLRVVFSCYLVVTLVVTGAQLYMEYNEIEKGVLTELYNVSQSFEDSIATGIWGFDVDALESNISGISKIEIIDGVVIMGSEEDPLANHGDFTKEARASELSQSLQFPHDEARKVSLPNKINKVEYYEYAFNIDYFIREGVIKTVGKVYLYSSRDTVIQRVSDSFTLIIINALIKTFGLWVIFLVTVNRMIASPLGKLTAASNALSKRDNNKELDADLQTLTSSKHKDELHILSKSFLEMKRSINDKIDNLNNLNQFAIALTQSQSQEEVLERVQYLVQKTFKMNNCRIFHSENIDNALSHSRAIRNINNRDSEHDSNYHYTVDTLRANHNVIYNHATQALPDSTGLPAGASNDEASANKQTTGETTHPENEEADSKTALNQSPTITMELFSQKPEAYSYLYIPLMIRETRFEELIFIGRIAPEFLDNDDKLITEYIGFLTILSSIASETLESIAQRDIIENQNKSLEKRVKERTQDLEQANEQLKFLALHDALTGLPNRTLFHDRLSHLIHTAQREGKKFSVANIDLTKFKDINDTYGHDVGDIVLKEVGNRFSTTLRKSDTIARMGGDEYAAIVIQETDHELVELTIKRLNESLNEPIYINDQLSLEVHANIGVAFYPHHSSCDKLLLKYSDIAMYHAKKSGKGYGIFDPIKNNEVENQQEVLSDLDTALDDNTLELYLEPTFDIKSGQIYALEAQLHWQHPSRGRILPSEYLHYAEQSDLIIKITQRLLEKASLFFKTWEPSLPHAHLSIHLSNNILNRLELAEILIDSIKSSGLQPNHIKLEVTESSFARNSGSVLNNLNKLHRYGFMLSIRNFGTGLSSLSQLTKLPLHDFQIDRRLLLSENDEDIQVIETAIKLAHALNVKIVADGLDQEEKINSLLGKGCDFAQGPFLCESLSAEEMNKWLIQYRSKREAV